MFTGVTCDFLLQLVFCKKKKKKLTMWLIGVEVEQETSAPLLKKILDQPLVYHVYSLMVARFHLYRHIFIKFRL